MVSLPVWSITFPPLLLQPLRVNSADNCEGDVSKCQLYFTGS